MEILEKFYFQYLWTFVIYMPHGTLKYDHVLLECIIKLLINLREEK